MRIACTLVAVGLAVIPVGAAAQTPQDLAFDRPESWGQKWAASLAAYTTLGSPVRLAPGQLELGGELAHVPTVSDEARRIGFDGIKLEDMNKSPVFGRLRARLGLGGGWALGIGFVPPVEVDGATPLMLGASVGGVIWDGTARLGVRAQAQWGRFQGDITCDAETVAGGTDLTLNPFQCEAISDDELTQAAVGGELVASLPNSTVTPYVSFGVTRLTSEFQVNARYSGVQGDDLLKTDGMVWTATGGVTIHATSRLDLTAAAFYAPLDVVRPPATASGNEGLFNLRGGLRYRLN